VFVCVFVYVCVCVCVCVCVMDHTGAHNAVHGDSGVCY
jgi:hypothetical protein